ncbi:MAG TPA: aminoglycoside phosphotransferase family protein [Blastocatellia bacterium]|nr:aminoglycoside phosphotransferase family protein [Blastocatellia bacterium]
MERIRRLCQSLSPRRRVASAARLVGGLSNSGFKIHFESGGEPVVLRIYERDPAACRKELELLRALARTVAVPEVLHAEPEGCDGGRPFVFLRYVEGVTFRQLKATADRRAIQEAAYAIGAALAAVGKHDLDCVPQVSDGPPQLPESINGHLSSPGLTARTGAALADRVRRLVADWGTRLRLITRERRLVHGDFRKQNILVRPDGNTWTVAAILDWECAFQGSQMFDVGVFLRYERSEQPVAEPAFSRGFRDGGGRLCEDWMDAARVVDLDSLCRSLTAPHLPPDIEREIVGLVTATAAGFKTK